MNIVMNYYKNEYKIVTKYYLFYELFIYLLWHFPLTWNYVFSVKEKTEKKEKEQLDKEKAQRKEERREESEKRTKEKKAEEKALREERYRVWFYLCTCVLKFLFHELSFREYKIWSTKKKTNIANVAW